MKKHIQKAMEHSKVWSGYIFILLGILLVFAVVGDALFPKHLDIEKHIWVEITLLLVIALLAERLVTRLKQPFVMVLLVLGVLISPYTVEAIWPACAGLLSPVFEAIGQAQFCPDAHHPPTFVVESELFKTFANLGAIILLFRIGLHSKIDLIFNFKNFAVAIGGVIIPFAVGYLYASMAGGSFIYSMFVGGAMTATSVGITVAVLEEMKVINKRFSQMILGAAVIDDILALMVLGLIQNIPAELTADAIAPFVQTLAIAAIFVISAIIIGKKIVNKYFMYEEKELSKFTLSGFLALMFFYSFAAESLGLSAIVGAFLAGLVIDYSPMVDRLNRALFPLDVVFTPIFFIYLGTIVNAFAIPELLVPIIILTLIAIFGKIIGCGIPAKLFGVSVKESLLVGYGMVPRGEIALIMAAAGVATLDALGNPILSPNEYTIIASMAFLTTVFVPPGLKMLIESGGKEKI